MLDPIFKFFSSPFSQGVEHFANISNKQLNFKEKLGHLAFGFFEMIPLLNVCVLYIDKKLNEKKIIVIDLSDIKSPAPADLERGIENKKSEKSPSTISKSGEEPNPHSSKGESGERIESGRSLEVVIEDESPDKTSVNQTEETVEKVESDLTLEVVVEEASEKTASADDFEDLEVSNPNVGRQSDQSSLQSLSELHAPSSTGNDPILKDTVPLDSISAPDEETGAEENFDIEKQLDEGGKTNFIDTAVNVGKVSIEILGLLFGAAFVGYSTYSLRSQQAEKDNGMVLYKFSGNSTLKGPLPVHNQTHHLNSVCPASPSFYEGFSGILGEDDPTPTPQDFADPLEVDQIRQFEIKDQLPENNEAKQPQTVPTSSAPKESQNLQSTKKGETKQPTSAPIMDLPIEKSKNPSICLFTSYTSDNRQRLVLSERVSANQQEYSKVRGYKYLEYPENLAVEGSKKYEPYWSKIAGLNRILNGQEPSLKEKPDWIVWLDDDAIISNHNIKFEDVIAHYGGNEETYFIVTEDAESYKNKNIPLNSAVLIVKNNNWSRKFFKKVWEMKDKTIPGTSHTYGDCKNQSCLHEQQAISELLRDRPARAKHVRIIPQKDQQNGWGINTFHRWPHHDLNRNNLNLAYEDPPRVLWHKGDFIGQCTGLSTYGYDQTSRSPRNLRLECVDQLIAETKQAEE